MTISVEDDAINVNDNFTDNQSMNVFIIIVLVIKLELFFFNRAIPSIMTLVACYNHKIK